MQIDKIKKAKQLAIEFLTLVEDYQSDSPDWDYDVSPKIRGALRRKSMDLTRSLAEMRKP